MDKISQNLKLFLEKYKIDNSSLKYLVAFSGGYDSMCLLDALKKNTKNQIIAIHLNHNWRGNESDEEEINCKNFCKSIGVEFYSEKLPENTPKTETEARNARYMFFEKCAKKFDSQIIFTAHNKNDNAETLIFRICHGTGIRGLQGIAPQRGIYYRPLLNISRKEIEQYCKINNLTPNNDSSNNDTIHKRNLIRTKILPILEEINPSVLDSINSLSNAATEENELIYEYLSLLKKEIYNDNKINTNKFINLSNSLQLRILYEMISPLVPENYDRERFLILQNFIQDNCNSKSGKTISVTTGKWLFVNTNFIEIINQKKKSNIHIEIKKVGEYENDGITFNISECVSGSDKGSCSDGKSVYVDLRGLDFDFELRNRKDGDIIQPLGMTGTQKLKKYLNSRKIPNHIKDDLLLLTQGNEVLWVAEIGISDKIKVKDKATHKITIRR